VAGRWFSPGSLVFSTNKTDGHDITAILLKVVLNTITLTTVSARKKIQNKLIYNTYLVVLIISMKTYFRYKINKNTF
jgi:hypothetical protein